MMKRSTDLGVFSAVARDARLGAFARRGEDETEDLAYAEVEVQLLDATDGVAAFCGSRDSVDAVRWRGGYSDAAVHRTIRSLLAMGATFPNDDPTDLEGVGSRPFRVRLVAVECDPEETHGRTGVFRVFVREVLPTDGAREARSSAEGGGGP